MTAEGDVNAVCSMSDCTKSKTQNHEVFTKVHGEKLHQNFPIKVKIIDSNVEFKDEFIKILIDFTLMREGHLGRANIVNYWIGLSPPDEKQSHSAPYQTGPKDVISKKNR